MHLLRFTSATKARNALGDAFDAALSTSLILADAVYEEDGDLVSERETVPGFWLLTPLADQPGQVATFGPAGVTKTDDDAIIGARLDPVWAGMPSEPLAMAEEPDPELDPVPAAISDRQFAQQLAVLGTITEAEAIAWAARGDLPDALEAAVAALPEEERFAARMLLSSATSYERAHPLVPMLGAIMGYDAAAIDDLWRAAAGL